MIGRGFEGVGETLGDSVDCEDGGCACGIVEYSKEIFPQGYRKIDEKEGQGIIAVNTRMVASDYGGGEEWEWYWEIQARYELRRLGGGIDGK